MSFQIWAAMNLTPDSFYPESRVNSREFVERALGFLADGADVLDIGAESSRPYSEPVSEEEEWHRLQMPLEALKAELGELEFKKKISIDTYKPAIARKALEMGAGYINDIQGAQEAGMLGAVSEFKPGYVIMHSQGKPKTMQDDPQYADIVSDVLSFLKDQTQKALNAGVLKENIIWDFGIGFGKTLEHNLMLLKNVSLFRKEGFPLMAGISRKSFMDKLLNIPDVALRRDPTMIMHTYLALQQVDILRVHDVSDTRMIRDIVNSLK